MGRSSWNGWLATGGHVLIIAALSSGVVLAQDRPAPLAARASETAVAASTGRVAASANSSAPARAVTPDIGKLELIVGRSTVVDIGRPITRVSLTSDDVADVLVTSASQILVNGKAPGSISMVVWEKGGAMHRYEVAVGRDLATLDRQLELLFPNETIEAHSSGKQIVLSGRASSKDVADRAVNVAAGFVAKRDEVVSLLQVAPIQAGGRQVLLRVRFAEVSRSALTELGVSLFTGPTGIENTLGRITTQQFTAPGFEELGWSKNSNDFGAPVESAEGKITFSDFLNFFVLNQKYDLGLLVRALQTRGLFQSLAEPNLVAESGKEASFLAGGEFPIPIAQGSGANIGVSVQFKEFGIRLSFLPTVTGDRVHLKVAPEVSMLDFNNAVTLGGFRIPALTTRKTSTELELRDGQTFAIAGLMNNTLNSTLQKIPGIGDIPILGYLFRSKAAQKNQTELVVIITPQILPEDSSGVTTELPRMQEPFLEVPEQNRAVPMPAPAFSGPQASTVTPAIATPAAVKTPAAPKAPAADERRTMEQAQRDQRAGAERARKDAQARAEADQRTAAENAKAREKQKVEEARKAKADQARLKAEQERQQKAAQEQARRDAEAAKRKAEEAKRQAEAERRRQQAVAEAAARLKAAQQAYEAQLAQGQ